MGALPIGSPWGSFQIERLLGESPAGSVYRATQSPGGRTVALRVFHEGLDESTQSRFEDDTRRLVGFSHPNVLRVESVGREEGRRYIVTEYFEALSLRDLGPRPLREGCEILLKAARGLAAAWMRLLLHRNLKPENILISARGEVKVADFGLFQEPTPYWSPERRKGWSPDMRGDLFSLGTIFKEFLKERDPVIDALLLHMTQPEPFDRVQMVEDVISRLESFLAKSAAPAPTPTPIPTPPPPPVTVPVTAPATYFPPPAPPPPPPVLLTPPWEKPWENLELQAARATMVRTLEAVVQRLQRAIAHRHAPLPPPRPESEIQKLFDLPVTEPVVVVRPPARPPAPPPPAPPPKPFVLLPPAPRKPAGGRRIALLMLIGMAFVIYFRIQRTFERRRVVIDETARTVEQQRLREQASSAAKTPRPMDQVWDLDDWGRAKPAIQKLDADMKYAEAAAACDEFVLKHGAKSPPESRLMQKNLKEWSSSVQTAERAWKGGQAAKAMDFLDRGGAPRAKDKERLLARWCEEDWKLVVKDVERSVQQGDRFTARDVLDRFLKKPHQGGAHQKEAEARKAELQADLDYDDLADRVDTLLRTRKESAAIEALEAFLALPHRGGSRRAEIEKKIALIREETLQMLFSGRPAITRIALSPSGKQVAFISGNIQVMDTESRLALWVQAPKSLVRQLAFAGETRLAQIQSSKITLWDISKQSEVRTLSADGSFFTFMALSSDGERAVALQSDGSLLTWDLEKEEPPTVVKAIATGVTAMALSPDGKTLAIALRDKTIRVRDLASGDERKWSLLASMAVALSWSPDGKLLASAALEEVQVWDVEKRLIVHTLQGHTGAVACVAFSRDGATLASGAADKTIRLWSIKDGSGAGVISGHRDRVTALGFLTGGRLLSASSDGTVRIWSTK